MNTKLTKLFEAHFGDKVKDISALRAHGSDRKLFRIRAGARSVIGVENSDRAENVAFVEFSRHFRKSGLRVPEIYAEDLEDNIYVHKSI